MCVHVFVALSVCASVRACVCIGVCWCARVYQYYMRRCLCLPSVKPHVDSRTLMCNVYLCVSVLRKLL